jgi:hypothetical protein
MLTRSQTKQSSSITSVTRSTRTLYYLRNLPIINYFEADDEDDYQDYYKEEYKELDFSYNNDDMPGPYDDIGPWCGSGYSDFGYYDGYNGYDN